LKVDNYYLRGESVKLISVREYAKAENISEQGARKRVATKLVKSVQLKENLYIVVEDKSVNTIKELRHKIKLLQSNIKSFKLEAVTVANQSDYIKKLEDRITLLETKLDESTAKKEELYEKVINTVMIGR
jgi:predicted RNase H-like nuclease (RuvC/YqgF family)